MPKKMITTMTIPSGLLMFVLKYLLLLVVLPLTVGAWVTSISTSTSTSFSSSSSLSIPSKQRLHRILHASRLRRRKEALYGTIAENDDNNNNNNTTYNKSDRDANANAEDMPLHPKIQDNIQQLHIVVLVHGWLGNPNELKYLQETLEAQWQYGYETSNKSTTTTMKQPLQELIVHAAVCNHGKTTDGIVAGGTRLAQEVDDLVRRYQYFNNDDDTNSSSPTTTATNASPQHYREITLSFVGNSLGGLYARYALSRLQCLQSNDHQSTKNKNKNKDKNNMKKRVTPKCFVTTCTPHLGISQHTYVRLPSWMETPIATVLRETGKDLFRRSSVIQDMTLHEKYITPLRQFEHRWAWINVYGTDFQVPTATAAFWGNTQSLHYESSSSSSMDNPSPYSDIYDRDEDEDDDETNHDNIVLRLETSVQHDILSSSSSSLPSNERSDNDDDDYYYSSDELSERLDALGWKKILVDVRKHLPISSSSSSSSGRGRRRRRRSTRPSTVPVTGTNEDTMDGTSIDNNERRTSSPMQQQQQRRRRQDGEKKEPEPMVWTSQELKDEFDCGQFRSFPLGHTVMVSNSKDPFNRYLTQGGQRTMDSLAAEILHTILQE